MHPFEWFRRHREKEINIKPHANIEHYKTTVAISSTYVHRRDVMTHRPAITC